MQNLLLDIYLIPLLTLDCIALMLVIRNRKHSLVSESLPYFYLGLALSILYAIVKITWSLFHPYIAVEDYLMKNYLAFTLGVGWFVWAFGIVVILIQLVQIDNRKLSVLKLILLSFISLGFFIPYWLILRCKQYQVPGKSGWLIAISIALMMVVFNLQVLLKFDESPTQLYFVITVVVAWISLFVIQVVLFFRLQASIEESSDEEFYPLLTFLFGPFYLQYKINKLERAKPNLIDSAMNQV